MPQGRYHGESIDKLRFTNYLTQMAERWEDTRKIMDQMDTELNEKFCTRMHSLRAKIAFRLPILLIVPQVVFHQFAFPFC